MHHSFAGGIRVALALTHRQDKFLQSIYKNLADDSIRLAVIAVGGYGRKELCFSSDIDIMFLTENEDHDAQITGIVHEFLHCLMDAGLYIGHSVRSISECIDIKKEDIESSMSLLEARYICGNKFLFKKLNSAMQEKVRNDDKKSFIQYLSEKTAARHNKYGRTSKLLEPNIKNSAGGLRDIHTAFWMMSGTGSFRKSIIPGNNETAILSMLKSAELKKILSPLFLRGMRNSFDFLLNVRNEMHLQFHSLHDTLEFNIQPNIASGMRYRSYDKRKKVDLFMQDYYKSSRSAEILCSHIIDSAKSKWLENGSEIKTSRLASPFVVRNKRLDLSHRKLPISNELVLKALLLKSERNVGLSFWFEDLIKRQIHFIKPLNEKNETDLLRTLLNRPNAVGKSVRIMNELGLLERWIPDWKPMVSFFQHNQYHFYTADEHTVIMLENAEALEHLNSSFGSVFRSLPRRDTLYLSCLFHDIAKPLNLRNHEIKGAQIAKRILRQLQYEDVHEDVIFLVRHHLLMEQVAFRRDLTDPHTIIEFAKVIKRVELLDYLYVLTYADLTAVNSNVFTHWKELLLSDLYRRTRTILEEEMTSDQVHTKTLQQSEKKKDEVRQALSSLFPADAIERHDELLSNPSYLSAFKTEEISAHINSIQLNHKVSALFRHNGRFSEVTFISKDEHGILSKLCGVLTANDANIYEAQIFTRQDGIIIDKFRVADFIYHKELSEEVCGKISNDIQELMDNRIDISQLIECHRLRWKRRIKPLNPNTRRDVVFREHPNYTIMDVYAPDTLGFLYRITGAISGLDLNIAFAKIATRVDGIVDSFYILNSHGKKLRLASEKKLVKKEILAAINATITSELVAQKD